MAGERVSGLSGGDHHYRVVGGGEIGMMRKLAPKTNYWEVKNYQTIYLAGDRRNYSWGTLLDEGMIDLAASNASIRSIHSIPASTTKDPR